MSSAYESYYQTKYYEIDVYDIDDILDSEKYTYDQLRGRLLNWHGYGSYPLVLFDDNKRIGIQPILHCNKCKKELPMTKTYIVSGLHNGAWCYIKDAQGNYVANLRDDVSVCKDCHEQ